MINRAEEFGESLQQGQNAAFIRERVGEIAFVHVYGDVDMANASELERALSTSHSAETRLFADLTNCRYMDSTGLAALVRAKKVHGEKFSVGVAPNSNLERLLKLAALYNILT